MCDWQHGVGARMQAGRTDGCPDQLRAVTRAHALASKQRCSMALREKFSPVQIGAGAIDLAVEGGAASMPPAEISRRQGYEP